MCSLPITAINAVAPPGGCIDLVRCITTNASETAKEADKIGFEGNTSALLTPTAAEILCPSTKFLGCEYGLFGKPYNNTALAPNEPIKNNVSSKLYLPKWATA